MTTTNRLHRFDVLTAWYKEHVTIRGFRPRTVKNYLFELSHFRRFLLNETSVADVHELSTETLQAYTSWLYDRHLSAKTINTKFAALRSFFKELYTEHKLYMNLASSLTPPRVGKRLPTNTLTEEETRALFDYLERSTESTPERSPAEALRLRDRAILEVLYSTGVRRNELLSLRLGHINATDGLLTVDQGKGGKDRVVPIGRKCIEAVDCYTRDGRPVLANKTSNDTLFLNCFGGPLGMEGVRLAVDKTLREAGITKHLRIHDLRHTCATHMLNHGADIRYVQELLGHASLSSTQVYTHVSITKLKESHRRYHPRESGEFTPDHKDHKEGPHGA